MSDNSMAPVLSFLPNTTYDLPAFDLSFGFVIKGEPGSFWSSHLVSSAGDVNGDGLDDLIVSARDTGKSYVVFGKQDTNAINLSAIAAGTSTDGFAIKGEPGNDYSGHIVSSAGDVNGDGLDDLIIGVFIGDPDYQSNAGKSYVIFSKKDNTDAIELSAIVAGKGGFVIKGASANHLSHHH
jgi:hypothetical protein